MDTLSVKEQLRQQLTEQVQPQGWYLKYLEKQPLTSHHSWLLMQPHRKQDVHAVYIAAFGSDIYHFLHWCKVYVFKDGKAAPYEWWGQWT